MKKNLSVITILFLFVGCGKSFLEIDPVGSITGEKIFTDVNGYTAALTGAYNLAANYHLGAYGLYGDLRGDNINVNTATFNSPEYNYESQEDNATGPVFTIWSSLFETLNNVNNIIESRDYLLTNFPNLAPAINSGYGQALVLRALCHFDLANIYAQTYTYTSDASHLGVPVLTETPFPGTHVPRQTIKKTYEQIINDLTSAIGILGANPPSSKIFASADAAQALLSRVYLYMHDWDNVILNADAVLKTNKYTLVSGADYVKMFIRSSQRTDYNAIDSEVLWQFNLLTNSTSFLTGYYSSDSYSVYPTNSFIALFEDGDYRKQQFVEDTRSPGRFLTYKYGIESEVAQALWPVNFKMIRSAELYLNIAEAYCHTGNYDLAAGNLAIVKRRAYANPDLTITYSSPSDLLTQIRLERRKELAFENQRIYDIMRDHENLNRGTECNSSTCTLRYPDEKFVLPIPRRELDVNPLMQPNPGVNN